MTTNISVFRNSPRVVISPRAVERIIDGSSIANAILQRSDSNSIVFRSDTNVILSEKVKVTLDTSRIISGETPTPTPNASQVIFTTANSYISGSLKVTRGTLRMHPTSDYSETSSTTFTMVVAPRSNEPLIVDYLKQ